MSKKYSYDVIVIGTGASGFSAIEAAVTGGASVCAIEAGKLGGECPNQACVPSKALLKSASVYRGLSHAREFGSSVSRADFNFEQVMWYRASVVDTITGGGERGDRYLQVLKKLKVDVKFGHAKFLDDHMIEVDGENLYGKAIVIATGTVDFVPPIRGLSDIPFKSWSDVLKQTKQPKSMAVIGAGPVGCEVATFYASFGTRVVLLQSDARVLNREDEQISELAREALIRTGIEVVTGAKIEETINSRGGVYGISASVGSAIETIAVEQVVVTAGKRSNVQGLDLDQADVRINDRGQIATDKQQRTNIQHIFAAGDVDGGMMFTHTAHHEGAVAGHNATLIAKKKRTKPLMADERVVPRVTFIDPEVASVGLTQQQASEKFGKVLVGRANIATLGRSVTDNARFGMCKLVAHPKTRKLIGAHVIGERAGEVIHEAALAIHLGASVDKIASMIHAYPTYSECMASSASSVKRE